MTSHQDVSTFPRRARTRGRHAATRQSAAAPANQSAVVQTSLVDVPAETASFLPVADLASSPRRGLARLLHPLTAILAIQAALSLTLIWSNTAFTDEADYLWIGRLVLGSWLHGRSWPASYGEKILPGSPLVYPPIGAVADSIGGLAGARVASLIFMLGATVLLYSTASKLVGRAAATFAAAAFVLTEPVIRLAFATAEPLSIFLTALAAWLIVAAAERRRHGEFVAAAAGALALANVTAYTGMIIDPVLVAFAFLVWVPRLGRQQAAFSTAWFAGAWVVFLSGLLTFSRSWTGFTAAVASNGTSSHENPVLVLTDIWAYAGLVVVLGLIGAVVAGGAHDRRLTGLVVVLGGAALIVPIVQLANASADLLDRRVGYGLWFAAIAAGYGCAKLVRWLPAAGRSLTVAACVIIASYLGLAAWKSAAGVYHGWPNSRAFVASFTKVAGQSQGLLFVGDQEHVAEYYTKAGDDWTRWKSEGLSLNPPTKPTVAYYKRLLGHADYGVVALFYSTSFTNGNLPPGLLTGAGSSGKSQQVLGSISDPGESGLSELTEALQEDPAYHPAGTGPFDNANNHGVYVIWRKEATK